MASGQHGAGTLRALWQRIVSWHRDHRGVAAIEFAFVAPVLLVLYFMTMEISQAIESNKKTGRVASMVADLVTQQQTIKKDEVDAIMRIGGAVIQPYNRSEPKVYVTAIEITNEASPKAKVLWSRKLIGGVASSDLAAGSLTTVPDKLKIPGSFLVQARSELDYRPVITWAAGETTALGLTSAFKELPMNEQYYLRPRMSQTIPCNDC